MLEKEVLKNPILLECLRTFVKEELDDEDFEIKNLIGVKKIIFQLNQ